jgi:hypothetical protein
VKILIACEFSGIVRDAFIAKGHDAWSCDVVPTERKGPHIINDVRNVLDAGWDMMIAFPPCTHLANSGARWWKNKLHEQEEALRFVQTLLDAPIPRIALENPVGIISTRIRKPSQIIQPYQFGDPFMKTTCLWIKALRPLFYTHVMAERYQAAWRESSGPNQAKNRSRTYPGIAAAMADQWAA